MPILEIQGIGDVEVDEGFLNLSPEQQSATVDEITASVGAQAPEGQVSDPFVLAGSVGGADVPLKDLSRSLVGQGLAFGFGDEIEAKIRSFFGENEDEALQSIREQIKAFQDSNPGLALTTEVVGALVPALLTGGAGVGASIAKQSARGAVTGSVLGGLGAAGRGEGAQDRIERGKEGALIGGAIGGIAPGSTELLRRGGSALARPVRSFFNPDVEASRRVSGAFNRDAQLGRGLGDQEFRTAQKAGAPVANIDRGGETTRALARSSANTSPEGRAALNRVIDDRFEGQGQRVIEFVDDLATNNTVRIGGKNVATGGTSTTTTRDALESAARRQNKPAYKKAYADGDRSLRSPEMERITSAPAVRDAMKRAIKSSQNRAVRDGFGSFNPGVRVTDDGLIKFTRTNAKGVRQFPNLQYWDAVKRELDDVAGRAGRAGSRGESDVARGLAEDLRNELDRLVPSFAKARSGAAKFFGATDAFEAGQKFVLGSQNLKAARAALGKMKPAERQLFARGYADSIIASVSKTRDRSNVIDRIWGNANVREKASIAFGPARAAKMEAFMRTEALMDLARGAIQGNSTTTRQLVEAGLAGGGFGLATGDLSPQNILTAAFVVGIGRKGLRSIDGRVAQRVAEMLASSNPVTVRRGATIVSRNTKLMNALRKIGPRLTTAIGAPVGAIAP